MCTEWLLLHGQLFFPINITKCNNSENKKSTIWGSFKILFSIFKWMNWLCIGAEVMNKIYGWKLLSYDLILGFFYQVLIGMFYCISIYLTARCHSLFLCVNKHQKKNKNETIKFWWEVQCYCELKNTCAIRFEIVLQNDFVGADVHFSYSKRIRLSIYTAKNPSGRPFVPSAYIDAMLLWPLHEWQTHKILKFLLLT